MCWSQSTFQDGNWSHEATSLGLRNKLPLRRQVTSSLTCGMKESSSKIFTVPSSTTCVAAETETPMYL